MTVDQLPLWLLFAGTTLCVLASIELGYRLGRFAHRRTPGEKESPVSAMTASVLGLTAFILAFTFGIVSERFDARKELVRQEANAIGTAWLRADFLPEQLHAEAKGLLLEYTESRLEFAHRLRLHPELGDHYQRVAKRIQGRLWEMAVANAREDAHSDVAALYVESLNDVFDVHALRIAVGMQSRVPVGIWAVLYLITFLGMTGVGYQTGISGSRRSMARPILALSFALVFTVIASLDRPNRFLTVSHQPLIDVRDSMKEDPEP